MFLSPHALIAAFLAAVAFTAGWQAQHWRMNSRMQQILRDHLEQVAIQEAQLRDMEQYLNEKLQNAIEQANEREQALRLDAAAAGNAAGRLRAQLQQLRGQLASLENPAAPAIESAAAATDLLGVCAARYSQLAAKADRHALDAVTCQQAWPAAQ